MALCGLAIDSAALVLSDELANRIARRFRGNGMETRLIRLSVVHFIVIPIASLSEIRVTPAACNFMSVTPNASWQKAIQDPQRKAGGVDCRCRFINKLFVLSAMAGFCIGSGECFSSCTEPLPRDTQMTLALIQDLLLATASCQRP